MERTSQNILFISMVMGIVSITYFFSLVLVLPLVITTLLSAGFTISIFVWIRRNSEPEVRLLSLKSKVVVYGVVMLGLYLLVAGAQQDGEKYGGWDAWWFWNYHAKYLASQQLWQEAYQIPYPGLLGARVAHSDYPVMLPATVGFFWRLFSSESNIIPFAVGFVFTCLIPLLIFFEIYRKNLAVASIVFLSIANHAFFVKVGVTQMADIVLSFFYLAAFVCVHHFRESRRPIYLTFCGIMLGSCIWLKNEGLMLSVVFVLFMFKELLPVKTLFRFLLGLLPFLLAYALFKIGYAPANDIIAAQGPSSFSKLTDLARHDFVYEGVMKSIDVNYPEMKAILVFYVVVCAIQRDIHLRYFCVILVCMIGYDLGYILSPHNTEWHVNTSIDRVLMHLIPATIYITSLKLTDIQVRSATT